MGSIRVVVEINYDIEVLGLKGIRDDLNEIINSGTSYDKVRKIYLEAKSSVEVTKPEDIKEVIQVILYDS